MTRKKNTNPITVTMAKNTCLIPNNTERTTISPKIAKRLHNFFFIIIYFFCLKQRKIITIIYKKVKSFLKKRRKSDFFFNFILSYKERLILPRGTYFPPFCPFASESSSSDLRLFRSAILIFCPLAISSWTFLTWFTT